MIKRFSKTYFAWAMWSIAICFVLGNMILQIYPSIMIKNLMRTFSINAATVGFIDSLFFYCYAVMQIPAGLLLDRFGAGRVLFIAFTISGVGVILYGLAPHPWVLGSARVLAGFGTSFAWVGLVYITSRLFDRKYFTTLTGISMAISYLGAILAQGPIALLNKDFYWRVVSVSLGAIGLALAILIFVVYLHRPRDSSTSEHRPSSSEVFLHLKILVSKPQTWIISVASFFYYAPVIGFAGFWGPNFLQSVHRLTKLEADFTISSIYLGALVGSLLIGKIISHAKYLNPYIWGGTLLSLASCFPILYVSSLPLYWLIIFLCLLGFFASAQLVLYPLLLFPNNKEASATAVAILSMVTLCAGFIFQILGGFLLDVLNKASHAASHIAQPPGDWKIAMTIFPLSFLMAFILSLLVKDYKSKAQN